MIDYIEIEGYKSIKRQQIKMSNINILIGSNGAGKSNFISFFEFLGQVYQQKSQQFVALAGGIDRILHQGNITAKSIKIYLSFEQEKSGYGFEMLKNDTSFIIKYEDLLYEQNLKKSFELSQESQLKHKNDIFAKSVKTYLDGLRRYHFHDTGAKSPFNQASHIQNDAYFLYERGENLAAFLYKVKQDHPKVYYRMIQVIRSIAPFFNDFYLKPNENGFVTLQWRANANSYLYGISDLSDGTLRFIALTVLFLQPNLPLTLIIDEPELGLHPTAINKLSGLIQSAANRGTQVILATQSTDLISYFTPEDIVTVDQKNGESIFQRLDGAGLEQWLEDYTLGDLWKRNIITGGQPQPHF